MRLQSWWAGAAQNSSPMPVSLEAQVEEGGRRGEGRAVMQALAASSIELQPGLQVLPKALLLCLKLHTTW